MPSRNASIQFLTGLITTDFSQFPPPPFRGAGWRINYRVDPHHRCSAFDGKRMGRGREVMISAASKVSAQRAVGLVHAASVLLWNDPLIANLVWTVERAVDEAKSLEEGRRPFFQINTQDLPLSCLIAAKASRKRQLVYALHKFIVSCQIYSPNLRNLDPAERFHFALSKFAEDHVRFAFAIIAAYSVVEELGLGVRVTKDHPQSYVNGQWDAAVKTDLERRLRESDVVLNETILWHLRATPTRLERMRPPRIQGKFRWARGPVRDSQMEVVDAIAHASWLRSKVSSHRLTDKVVSLSPYDVANVQHLARRLLLERLGFWNYHLRQKAR